MGVTLPYRRDYTCTINFMQEFFTICEIIMFKVEKQGVFPTHPKAKISSLSNFKEICLYFFDDKISFYTNRLS